MDEFKLHLLNLNHQGNKCKVIDEGKSYTCFSEWGTKYLDPFKYITCDIPSEYDIYTCIVLASHLDYLISDNEVLVGIQSISTGQQYIVGLRGIEFIPEDDIKELKNS